MARLNCAHCTYFPSRLSSLSLLSYKSIIGVGLSSTPDGITVVQRSVDIEIAAALVQGLKTSWDGHRFGKVVGVGHGYGRYGSDPFF